MAIEFINIKSGERRRITTEPMLSAFYNSSDQGPNSHEGQDFSWRLAPETIARIRTIKGDEALMNKIAATFQLPLDGVKETDILYWISLEEGRNEEAQSEQTETQHRHKYEDDIRKLEEKPTAEEPKANEPVESPQNEVPEELTEEPKSSEASNSKTKTDNAKIKKSNTNKEDK